MEYKNTYKTLDHYGLQVIKGMKDILIKNKKRATGRLINSIDYDVEQKKNNFKLTVEFLGYGKYVNKKNSWKRAAPPVDEIKKWVKAKGIPLSNVKGKTGEKKLNNLAFAISKKILKRGTLNPRFNNPTHFLKPFNELDKSSFKKDLSAAYKKDTGEEIGKIIKKINKK